MTLHALTLLLVATPGTQVVTVRAAGCEDAFFRLVWQELHDSGFAEATEGVAAQAELSLRCEHGAVVAHIDDHVTDKSVERRIELGPPLERGRAAVRVVELLHASLAESTWRALATAPLVTTPVEAPVAAGHWFIRLDNAAVATQGLGVSDGPSASVERLVGPVAVGVSVFVLPKAGSISRDSASVDLHSLDAMATVAWPLQMTPRLTWMPLVRLGATFMWATAKPSVGYATQNTSAEVMSAQAGVRLDVAVTSWLSLSLGLAVSTTLQPIVIRLPEGDVRIGQPGAVLTTGVLIR